jgi:hypothetical protein
MIKALLCTLAVLFVSHGASFEPATELAVIKTPARSTEMPADTATPLRQGTNLPAAVRPKAKPAELFLFSGNEAKPEHFVTDIAAGSIVTYAFTKQPDFDKAGWQEVEILLTDSDGYSSTVKSRFYMFQLQEALAEAGSLKADLEPEAFIVNYIDCPGLSFSIINAEEKLETGEYDVAFYWGLFNGKTKLITADTIPPVITGALNKTAVAGGTIAYRKDIAISDTGDHSPKLAIDSSGVKLNQPGEYDVIYKATDASGNEGTAKGRVTVWEAGMSEVDALADEILAEIIEDDMTLREKAYAIFTYVAEKVKYRSGNSPRELAQAAYVCFTRGVGDCFVYNAGSQVLLGKVGIPYHIVERHNGKTEHFWLIIDTGEGWYHFDASSNVAVEQDQRFMFTDAQAKEFTARIGNGRRYYEYDESTVPDVVDE